MAKWLRHSHAEHRERLVCTCREVPAEPFPRLVWAEDCPDHGKAVNPYWPDERCGIDGCLRLAQWVQPDFPESGLSTDLCNFHAEPFMTGREQHSSDGDRP